MKKLFVIIFTILITACSNSEPSLPAEKADVASTDQKKTTDSNLTKVYLIRSEIREEMDTILDTWQPVMDNWEADKYDTAMHDEILEQISIWKNLDDLAEEEIEAISLFQEMADVVYTLWEDMDMKKEMGLGAHKIVYRGQVTQLKSMYFTWRYEG